MIRTRPVTLTLATAFSALLAVGAHAQDTNSATDASGKPVEAAGDSMEMEQTDGLIRYGDADEMFAKLADSPEMADMAAERWPEIDAAKFEDVGDKDALVSLVADGYSIDEQDATREVDSWVMETADGM